MKHLNSVSIKPAAAQFIDLALASAFPLFAIGIEHPLFLQGRFRPVAIEDALDGGCIELAAKFLGK